MSRFGLYALGAAHADAFVKRWRFTLPIDPFKIAANLRILVVPRSSDIPGIAGMLVRRGNRFAIGYATHINNEPFQRFTIAHELGHYYMPGHVFNVFDEQDVHVSGKQLSSNNRYEMEADGFAAGLLMPRHLFAPAIESAGEGLDGLTALAKLCNTSLHATAIRYVQCVQEPVAIIVSSRSRIEQCLMSDALKAIPGVDRLGKGHHLPHDSATYRFNQDRENVRRAERAREASYFQDWFGGYHRITVDEDVMGLGSYGKTLTMLHNIDVERPKEGQRADAFAESWKLKFGA